MEKSLDRGWTLPELLLAVVLIAGGLVLLMSAYTRVRERALSVECSARLRALGQAVLLHCAEKGGRFPRSGHSGASWAVAIAPYLGEPVLSNALEYRSRKAYVCPANVIDGGGGPDEPKRWSYGINVFFELSATLRYTPAGLPILGSRDSYRGSPATWHRLVDVPSPTQTVLMAENPHTVADHFMAHQWNSGVTARNAVATNRHGGTANYLFVDGHVRALTVEQTFDPATGVNLWNPSLAP